MNDGEKKHPRPKVDLIARLRESLDKLERDGSTRGDLKVLNRALGELRYAFKVFAPYRRTSKGNDFWLGPHRPEHPAYQHAVAVWQLRSPTKTGWSSPERPAGSWKPAMSAPVASTRWA